MTVGDINYIMKDAKNFNKWLLTLLLSMRFHCQKRSSQRGENGRALSEHGKAMKESNHVPRRGRLQTQTGELVETWKKENLNLRYYSPSRSARTNALLYQGRRERGDSVSKKGWGIEFLSHGHMASERVQWGNILKWMGLSKNPFCKHWLIFSKHEFEGLENSALFREHRN